MKGKLIILLVFFIPLLVQAQRKKVLVFHSYNEGLTWTDNVNKGIHRAFKPVEESVELFFEYLDRKRNLNQDYFEGLEKLYEIKLKGTSFDLVITSDNDALDFVLRNRKKYFGETPVVFCGINNYSPSMIENQKSITGITEDPDFKATIDLITALHKNSDKLYIINDNKTTTAIENIHLLKKLEPFYHQRLRFIYWDNLRKSDFYDSIRSLDDQSVILLLTFNKDKDGTFLSYRDNIDLIPKDVKAPVYTTWKFFMNGRVIGGKMISGEEQGFKAGQMAIEILQGKQPDSIPVIIESLSQYIFDYNQLKKYKISLNKLPAESQILNKPVSLYSTNKKLINIGIIILSVALAIILILSNAIRKRVVAEKSLQQKQKHLEDRYEFQKLIADVVVLLNSTNDFTKVTDPILQRITNHYHIGKVSLYKFDVRGAIKNIIGSKLSIEGKGILELKKQEYSKLNRIIEELKKSDLFISENLSNLTPEEQTFYQQREIGAIAIFPIRVGTKLIGMAGFSQAYTYKWDESEINELTTLVQLIANAWERNMQMNMHLEVEKKHVKAIQILEKSSRLASIGVMASGITHEINQPLNALRVTVDSIAYWERQNSTELPEIIKNKLTTLKSGISRIDEIIRHMRNFWIAPSSTESELEVDLVQIINNAYSLLETQISEQKITTKLILPENEIMIKASFIQIEQIVINLLVNAMQALKNVERSEKRIVIKVKDNAGHIRLSIADNGPGIPDEIGETLFDPFYSGQKESGGTGLGLAIVKTFVEKLGGKIEFKNNAEGGVTFTLTLYKLNKPEIL